MSRQHSINCLQSMPVCGAFKLFSLREQQAPFFSIDAAASCGLLFRSNHLCGRFRSASTTLSHDGRSYYKRLPNESLSCHVNGT